MKQTNIQDLSILLIEDSKLYSDFICSHLRRKLGISEIDIANTELLGRTLVERRNHQIIISDTMCGDSYPYGPIIVAYARSLGRTPLVIALSTNPDNEKVWTGNSQCNYFFWKGTFNCKDVKKVLGVE